MSTARKPAAAKSVKATDLEGYDVVDVEDVDYTNGQINEARQKKWAFKVGETFYKVKPVDHWSFEAEEAWNYRDYRAWAKGALENPAQLADLVKERGSWWAAIVFSINRDLGLTPGEDGNSSDS